MNLEWDVAHELQSALGSVFFNVADPMTGRIFRIQADPYKMIPSLRVTQDNISQADGSVLHPRWKSGMVSIIQVALDIMDDPSVSVGEFTPACGADLREMSDELLLHLNAIRSQDDGDVQRLFWTPTGLGDRQMLLNIELLTIWEPSYDLSGTEAMIQFAVESPFPYLLAATQVPTTIPDASTVVINNAGTDKFSPVAKISNQSASVIQFSNLDDLDADGNPFTVIYDTARPDAFSIPGSDYGEMDFFQGTFYLNGDGADLIAGIDPEFTDFWHLNPGDNRIQIIGADALVLSNDAWA